MPLANQIADWLVEYCAKELGAPMDPMGLEKNLYYAQSFSLALSGRPIFPDDFQAWKHGPVVHNVWQRYSGSSPITARRTPLFSFSAAPLFEPNPQTRDFLADVVSFFARLSATELSRSTHIEGPWCRAREGTSPREYSNEIIPKSDMQEYYKSLMELGEEALSNCAVLDTLPTPRWGWTYVAGICASGMSAHPFYFHGLSLWGNNRDFWVKPSQQPQYDRSIYEPLSSAESEDVEVFDSAEEFLASLPSTSE